MLHKDMILCVILVYIFSIPRCTMCWSEIKLVEVHVVISALEQCVQHQMKWNLVLMRIDQCDDLLTEEPLTIYRY